MSDIARVLLTAAVLSVIALSAYVWKLTRPDVDGPEHLVGQLRLAQWGALVLTATGAVSIGLAIVNGVPPFGSIEITIGLAFVVLSGFVLGREPRDALLLCIAGLLAHALLDVAHRPGALPSIAPMWYLAGCATYNVVFAALCYWARRT